MDEKSLPYGKIAPGPRTAVVYGLIIDKIDLQDKLAKRVDRQTDRYIDYRYKDEKMN